MAQKSLKFRRIREKDLVNEAGTRYKATILLRAFVYIPCIIVQQARCEIVVLDLISHHELAIWLPSKKLCWQCFFYETRRSFAQVNRSEIL